MAKTAAERTAKSRKKRVKVGQKRFERWLKVEHHEAARKLLDALASGLITPDNVDGLIEQAKGEQL